jgi:peptidoglycan/LPS O-acetylase OafA/YrhL
MDSKPRLPGVQALRAVAALLVVWVHTIPAHFAPAAAGPIYWQDFGSCGVDIFFVISGFIVSLVAARGGTARAFLANRITRIYPLYWLLSGVMFAGGMATHQLGGIHQVWWLPTLLLLPGYSYPANPPLLYLGWTLLFEMYFYLVLAGLLACNGRAIGRGAMLFFSAMVTAGVGFGIRHPLLVIWGNPLILEFVFGCAIGLCFARRRDASWERVGKAVALAGALLLAATLLTGPHAAVQLSAVFAGEGCWTRVMLWGVPAALLVGGVIFWAPAMDSTPARLLVFLGNASYSIYLCTIPALWLARQAWRSFGQVTPAVGMVLDGAWSTAIGVACYLLLERPLTHYFQARQEKAGASPKPIGPIYA